MFQSKLHLKVARKGYILTRPLKYLNGQKLITVPAGFETDLASIPRIFRPIFTGHGKSRKPAALHDYLYHVRLDRKEADQIFYDALLAVGMNRLGAWTMYRAVRAGGWVAYL
jgi:hypothetical protein